MKTLLKHANYLDVSYEKKFIDKDILIEGDRIAQIDDRIDESGCDLALDLERSYVLPGLIDLHVHLCWDGSADPVERLVRESPELTLLRMVRHAGDTLRSGITTVRDLGSVNDLSITLSRGIQEKVILGPRIIAAGKSIIMTGGHDPFWGICVDGPWEAIKAVRKQAEKGAQVIKVSATGGVYGRREGEEVGQSELTRPELEAICREAHRLGLRVASHAIGEDGIDASVWAGCDTIEHGILVQKETLQQMVKQGTSLTPTLFIYKKIAEGNAPSYAKEKAKRVREQHRQAFLEARAMGIHIAAGSDAGSPEAPHPSLFRELEEMTGLGLSPLEVISISTLGNARVLGMDHLIGSIDAGKIADLLILFGNPLEDLQALSQIRGVVKEGHLIKGEIDNDNAS